MQIFEKIQQIIEDYYLLPAGSIQLKTRKREIVQARQMAHAFADKYGEGYNTDKEKHTAIGLFFVKKDRTTVLHSIKVVIDFYSVDAKFRADFDEIDKRVFFAKVDYSDEIKEKAEEIYNSIYCDILEADTDASNECVISMLSKKLALKQVSAIIAANPTTNTGESTVFFWMEVKKYIETNY